MTRFVPALSALCLAACLLAGCLTQAQLIERRIRQKSDFFASLPPDSQLRLRAGKLQTGDARDAAWIVYGAPDRVYQKTTAGGTNEVWAYEAQGAPANDEYRPVYYPIRTYNGRTYWRADYPWAEQPHYRIYEYQRIELEGDRVIAIESERP